MNNVPELSE